MARRTPFTTCPGPEHHQRNLDMTDVVDERPSLAPRPGRSTVPYTEPGPTMHENFRVLQEEAEGAYELLGELAPILGNIAASAFPEPGRALDALNRVRAHLKTYEERYRKQGGGQ